MKKIILFLFLLAGLQANAQEPHNSNKEQKIEALYIAYISRELNLTEEDAQKFWPVHSQYDKEIRTLKLEASELDKQQAILNIKKKYQDRFSKILGSERTNDFFIKDGEFRKKLIERLKNMRQQQGPKDGMPMRPMRKSPLD
jgi:hypothetical protein